MRLSQMIQNLHRDESGQDVLEYALVLAAVALAAVAGSSSIASIITSAMGSIGTKIQNRVASA